MKFGQEFSLDDFKNKIALFKSSQMRMTNLLQKMHILSYLIIYEDFILNRLESLHTLQKHIGLTPIRLQGKAQNKIAHWEFTETQEAILKTYEIQYGRKEPIVDAEQEFEIILQRSG